MQVVHLSTYDNIGGAARASDRLHRALCAEGVESRLIVRTRRSDDPRVSIPSLSSDWRARGKRWWRRQRAECQARAIAAARPADADGFHGDHGRFGAELIPQLAGADVIHLHWTQDFLDIPALLPELAKQKPVVWTHHDLHGLTGGCHYPGNCEQWKSGCHRCPQFTRRPDSPLPHGIWMRLNRAIAAIPPNRLHLVAASRWVEQCLRSSPRFSGRPCHCIPLGLDTSIFRPRDRAFSRDLLGLPPDADIVLFVSDATANPRKGFSILAHAASLLARQHPNLLLVSIGQGAVGLPDVPHQHLGAFSDDRWLSLAYSAADVFVIPSLEEAYGQTMLEALACGTAVVGSDTGGIPDLVRPNENGLLFPSGDSKALAQAVRTLLDTPDLARQWGQNGRAFVERAHSFHACATAHMALYRSLLA